MREQCLWVEKNGRKGKENRCGMKVCEIHGNQDVFYVYMEKL